MGDEAEPLPHVPSTTVEMTIVAQDPSVVGPDGHILTARVRVPAVRLEPGPRSHRFHVIDYDASSDKLGPPAVLTDSDGRYRDRFENPSDETVLADSDFHAQHVYAVAARTLATFEVALGRRLSWGFPGHELYLVPHAMFEPNAFYTEEDRALLFGYFHSTRLGKVLTCLSHDIVAHETAHAVLDGLRHRYLEPALPDQAAFHEALADIVALLSLFSLQEVVEVALGPPTPTGRIDATAVTPEALQANMLFVLAEQVGSATSRSAAGLRRSAALVPSTTWRNEPAFQEPHRRGEVLVAIIVQTLIRIWCGRLGAITHAGEVDRVRAAEEGAKSAEHVLRMVIRALDYLPPVEFEYEDLLEAILVSDAEMTPDDDRHYRRSLKEAFAAFGLVVDDRARIVDLTAQGWVPRYHGLNWTAMRSDRDEVYRFLWENAAALGVETSHYTHVESVRPAVRVGPDGLVVNEVVADYVQRLELVGAEFGEHVARWAEVAGDEMELELPTDVKAKTKIQLWGGGTLIFDQFGRAKYHVAKPLEHAQRQLRRIEHLARTGAFDRRRRLGFSTGVSAGQRFAELHQSDSRVGENW